MRRSRDNLFPPSLATVRLTGTVELFLSVELFPPASTLVRQRNSSTVPVSLTVAREGGNKSSPLLYGVMFEVSTIDVARPAHFTESDFMTSPNPKKRYVLQEFAGEPL
jgi:hypothetical protein